MGTEWLVANVPADRSPYIMDTIAERAILGVILAGRCFGSFRPHLMGIEWLVTNVTAVGFPD